MADIALELELRDLDDLVGEEVTVCANADGRNRQTFGTQLSVVGRLERHPTATDRYRVVQSAGTFAYFAASDVWMVNPIVTKCPTVIFVVVPAPEEE